MAGRAVVVDDDDNNMMMIMMLLRAGKGMKHSKPKTILHHKELSNLNVKEIRGRDMVIWKGKGGERD